MALFPKCVMFSGHYRNLQEAGRKPDMPTQVHVLPLVYPGTQHHVFRKAVFAESAYQLPLKAKLSCHLKLFWSCVTAVHQVEVDRQLTVFTDISTPLVVSYIQDTSRYIIFVHSHTQQGI